MKTLALISRSFAAFMDRFAIDDLQQDRFGDRLTINALAAIGAAHIGLLASLLAAILWGFSTSSAHAQAAPNCTGANLLLEMASDDPASYRKVLEQAAQTPYGTATLFKISKAGVADSYLYGTMHLTDPRVVDLSASAAKALEGAMTVAIETTEILDEAAMQMQLLARPETTMFVGGERLSDFMDAEQKAVVEEGLAAKGMRLALVDRMKPWILSGMLALPACEAARKQAGVAILDVAIAKTAKENGKTLVGLETVMEQLDAMASLPMDAHIDGLVETLRMADLTQDVIETMIVLYKEGQISTIWPLLRSLSAATSKGDTSSHGAAFEEIMVTARNKTMFERSLPLLEQGNAFIAVGALHLPGKDGLANMFADAGYTVTPLKN